MKSNLKPCNCKYCGTTNPDDFYRGNKSVCYTCRRKWAKEQPYYNSKEKRDKAAKWNRMNIIKVRWQAAKHRARRKGLEFNIDEDDIIDTYFQQEGKCVYTQLEFINEDEDRSMSIDRIDSTKGYVKGNIQLVCSIINYMKSNIPEDQFFFFCERIIQVKYGIV